jgi:hypothetical protein
MFVDTSFQEYRSARIEARFSDSTEIYRQRDERRAAARASGSNAHIAIPSLNGEVLSSNMAPPISGYSGDLTSLPSISSMIRAAMPLHPQSAVSSKYANYVNTNCDCDMYDSDDLDDLDDLADKENVPPEDIPPLQMIQHNPELLTTGLSIDEEVDEHLPSDDSVDLMTSEADLPDIVSSLESPTMFSSSGYSSSMATPGYPETDCSAVQCFYLPELFDQEDYTTRRLHESTEIEESAYRAKRRRIYEYSEPSNTGVAVRRSARLNPARLARV